MSSFYSLKFKKMRQKERRLKLDNWLQWSEWATSTLGTILWRAQRKGSTKFLLDDWTTQKVFLFFLIFSSQFFRFSGAPDKSTGMWLGKRDNGEQFRRSLKKLLFLSVKTHKDGETSKKTHSHKVCPSHILVIKLN